MKMIRCRQVERRGDPILLVLALLALPAGGTGAQSPATPAPSTPPSSNSRACSANPVLSPGEKSKHAHKTKHPLPPEPAPACLELKGEGIELQEFLQSTAREQQWRMGENRASEDTWTFVRYFNPDELDRYADTKVLNEPVKFSSGKAAVAVRTTEIENGYVRVQISVHFRGDGKSSDKVWGQPTGTWPLNSRGVLEQEILTVLQAEYKPIS